MIKMLVMMPVEEVLSVVVSLASDFWWILMLVMLVGDVGVDALQEYGEYSSCIFGSWKTRMDGRNVEDTSSALASYLSIVERLNKGKTFSK